MSKEEQSLLKQREEARQIKNAKGKARKVAKKHNIPKICDNCGLDEECIINFRDKDVYNNNPENLFYLCNPCFQEKKSNGHIKKEEYAKCTKCSKIRIFAPSLFNGKSICNKCCHEEIIEQGLSSDMILYPMKIRSLGLPETVITLWYDQRGVFSSNLFKKEKTSEESKLIKKFLEDVQNRINISKSISVNDPLTTNNKPLPTNVNIIFEWLCLNNSSKLCDFDLKNFMQAQVVDRF